MSILEKILKWSKWWQILVLDERFQKSSIKSFLARPLTFLRQIKLKSFFSRLRFVKKQIFDILYFLFIIIIDTFVIILIQKFSRLIRFFVFVYINYGERRRISQAQAIFNWPPFLGSIGRKLPFWICSAPKGLS